MSVAFVLGAVSATLIFVAIIFTLMLWDDHIWPLYANWRGDEWKIKNGYMKVATFSHEGEPKLYKIENEEISRYK